jgi:hypothetical protein
MVTDKLKTLGLTNTNCFQYYRCEIIYIQRGRYFPTIASGYKDAAVCDTLEQAHKWIDEKKKQ